MAQTVRGGTVVATRFDGSDCPRRFLIRPNCSLSWRDTLRVYAGIVFVSMSIAAGFAVKGAWLVLPFAGLEMLLLGVAFYAVARRSANWQEVTIENENILVIEGAADKQKTELAFQRAWVRVAIENAAIVGHPSRLLLRSHNRSVEIGGCLNEEEKQALAVQLKRAIQLN